MCVSGRGKVRGTGRRRREAHRDHRRIGKAWRTRRRDIGDQEV
jgi:hypothetical protein